MDNWQLIEIRQIARNCQIENNCDGKLDDTLNAKLKELRTKNNFNWVFMYSPLGVFGLYVLWYIGVKVIMANAWKTHFWPHIRKIFTALIITGGVVFVTVYVFYPTIISTRFLRDDIKLFDQPTIEQPDRKKKVIATDPISIKHGIVRIFDMDTSINLDKAMFAIREMTGYSENREDDIIDTAAIIRDIIIPRILANYLDEIPINESDVAGYECKMKVGKLVGSDKTIMERLEQGDVKSDKEEEVLKNCRKTVAEKCVSNSDSNSDIYKKLKCSELQIGTGMRTGFSWLPDVVDTEDPLSSKDSEECKTICDASTTCKASVFHDNKCHIIKEKNDTPDIAWKMLDREQNDAELYLNPAKDKTSLPIEKNIQILVEEILASIKLTTRLVDLTPFREEITNGLRESLSKYDSNQTYFKAVVSDLILESKRQSDPKATTEEGGEVKVDLAKVDAYMENTKVYKFKSDIAWPVIRAAVSVLARNKHFQTLAKRQIVVAKFNNIYTYTLVASVIAVILFIGSLNALLKLNILWTHRYPLIPIIVLEIVLYVSILSIVIKGLHKFEHAALKQADNSYQFAVELAKLANLFSAVQFKSDFVKDETIVIDESLMDAVIKETSRGVQYTNMLGNDDLVLSKAVSVTGRNNLLKQIALVLERYDKCNNIMYRGGIPFPTASVTAYLGIVIIGLGALFSVPGVNPGAMLHQLDVARALLTKSKEAEDEMRTANNANVLAMLRGNQQEYLDKLCEIWKKTNSETRGLKSVVRNICVFVACIFGVQYVITTSTETKDYLSALSSGVLGIVGNCV